MNKYIRAILIGAAAGGLVFFLMAQLDAMTHSPLSLTTWFSGLFVGALTAYALANLAGNRKVATADAAAQAAALSFTPPPGRALIYVYRDGFVGKAAGMNLTIDGKLVAQLTSPRFTCISVAPGQHSISIAFGGLAGPQNRPDDATILAEADQAYVFKLNIAMGMLQNTITLRPMGDLAAAKTALSRMKMTVPDVTEV